MCGSSGRVFGHWECKSEGETKIQRHTRECWCWLVLLFNTVAWWGYFSGTFRCGGVGIFLHHDEVSLSSPLRGTFASLPPPPLLHSSRTHAPALLS